MDDLISRQAAIDALHMHLMYRMGTDSNKKRLDDWINGVPSAQPEIVRCHKCIHWDRDTIRQNSNDAGWWNEAICERHSNEIWTSWKDADWYCADAERREE